MNEKTYFPEVAGVRLIHGCKQCAQRGRTTASIELWMAFALEEVSLEEVFGNSSGQMRRNVQPSCNGLVRPHLCWLAPEQQKHFKMRHRGNARKQEPPNLLG